MSSFDDVATFPLCWPEGWPRTRAKARGQFRQSVYTAIQNLTEQMRLMEIKEFILSTSVPLRRDGLPMSKPPVDGDHGAALYFTRKGRPLCLACDKYFAIEDNIQALAKTIEAMRGIERWGSTDLLDRAFTGFAALPAPKAEREWWEVLGVSRDDSLEAISRARNALAMTNHPDRGGSDEVMAEINGAWTQAKAERGQA